MIDGKTFELRTVNSKDDGIIRMQYFTDGVITGCSASVTDSAIHLTQGYFVAHGRQVFLSGGHDIGVANLIASGYLRLKFVINLSAEPTAEEFLQGYFEYETNTSNAFPALVKEEINISGVKYETEFGVYSIAGGKLTGVVSQPPRAYRSADRLNGKFESELSVYNAARLNGKTEANLSVGDSAKLNGKTAANLYVGNSAKLEGLTAADFATRPTMGAQTLYVNPNGSDAEGRGTHDAPYRTLQYAYDNIPVWWYGPVTIELSNGDHNNKVTDSHVAFRNAYKKNISNLNIHGTDSMNPIAANGSRFYGQFYISDGLNVNIEGVTIMPPYNDYKDSLVYVHNSKVTMYNCRILGGESNYKMNAAGRLLRTALGAYAALQNVLFARAQNAIQASTSTIMFSGCTMDGTVEVPFLAYGGGLINFGGTNSATGSVYKNGGTVFVNGAIK